MKHVTLKITYKKKTAKEWFTWYILIMPFFLSLLQKLLGLPGMVRYSIDGVLVILAGLFFVQKRVVMKKGIASFFLLLITVFIYMTIVYMFRYQSIFYFFWGVRNNFRFYLAFFFFVLFFHEEDAEQGLRIMDEMFWVNGVISLYQFFILGYKQDYLGGIFGVERGCNAYSIIFFSIVVMKSILSYMNKEEKLLRTILKCSMALILAAMAELKIFFVFFILILISSVLVTGFSKRKLVLVLASGLLFIYAGGILAEIFGEGSHLSFERIMELITAANYATAEDLGRFTAIPKIEKRFLGSLSDQIFGLGLGNCDVSAFSICSTPFYDTYAKLHYTWFSSAFLFLETGLVGLTLYLLFFIACFWLSYRKYKERKADRLHCQMAMIMAILCVILTFYNSSLRMEVAYLAYFILALPYIT